MTIHLPNDLELSIEAVVNSGRFASVDEAMAEAARRLLHDLGQGDQANPLTEVNDPGPDPILGCMRDDAELMDEIVADSYRQRRHESWREIDL